LNNTHRFFFLFGLFVFLIGLFIIGITSVSNEDGSLNLLWQAGFSAVTGGAALFSVIVLINNRNLSNIIDRVGALIIIGSFVFWYFIDGILSKGTPGFILDIVFIGFGAGILMRIVTGFLPKIKITKRLMSFSLIILGTGILLIYLDIIAERNNRQPKFDNASDLVCSVGIFALLLCILIPLFSRRRRHGGRKKQVNKFD
jgi:hypothetical protein